MKQQCPKCKIFYEPRYKSLEETEGLNIDTIYKEQHLSKICSNKCWFECSEEEIILHKYINNGYEMTISNGLMILKKK